MLIFGRFKQFFFLSSSLSYNGCLGFSFILINDEQVIFIETGRVARIPYNETGSIKMHALLITPRDI